KGDTADGAYQRDLRQIRSGVPAIERERQGPPHARIVERLLLVVRGDQPAAIPVAGLHRDLVAERLLQLVAHGRRKAAKLDRGAVAADRVDPGRLLVGEDAFEAIEI